MLFEKHKNSFCLTRGSLYARLCWCLLLEPLFFLVDYFIRQNEIRKKNIVEYYVEAFAESFENRFFVYLSDILLFVCVPVSLATASSLYTFLFFLYLSSDGALACAVMHFSLDTLRD